MPVRLMPRPAPLEMLTMRPPPAAFMPGAAAWAKLKAPVTLTWAVARRPPFAGFASAAVTLRPSVLTSQAKVTAPRAQKACAMARPKPCPAPVTTTDLPAKPISIAVLLTRGFGEEVEVSPAHRPPAVFDIVDQRDQPAGDRRRLTVLGGDLGDDGDLRVDLGLALAHGKIAPDAAMRFRRAAIMRHHRRHRALGARGVGIRHEGAGIGAVEAFRLDALGERHRHDLAAERAVEREMLRRGQRVGDRFVGQRRREEQRAITELAPEIAPDIAGDDRVGLEVADEAVERGEARRALAVDLAEHDGAVPAIEDAAGPQIVGAEIDE